MCKHLNGGDRDYFTGNTFVIGKSIDNQSFNKIFFFISLDFILIDPDMNLDP